MFVAFDWIFLSYNANAAPKMRLGTANRPGDAPLQWRRSTRFLSFYLLVHPISFYPFATLRARTAVYHFRVYVLLVLARLPQHQVVILCTLSLGLHLHNRGADLFTRVKLLAI